MGKVVVVGDEEFTMGFEIVGIESHPTEKFEEIIQQKETISIVVVNQKDYEGFSIKVKNQITKMLKPIVVILSEDDIKGSSLKEKVIKVLGVDLMK